MTTTPPTGPQSSQQPKAAHAPTPLEERLIRLIEDHGPIRVGDYIADALGHPQHGYYISAAPFGADGDFTTAPEISQIFGELIGAWLIHSWEEMGAPSLFNLIELGPGRGVLMQDILRTAKIKPAFLKAMRVYMVETSGRLRYEQQRRMQDLGVPVTWASDLYDIPAAPSLFVANEFFDCLPIRQFVRQKEADQWRERLVGFNSQNGEKRLCFLLSEEIYDTPKGAPQGSKPGDFFESCDAGREIIHALASRLKEHKGRALIIDYGHGRSGFGDTLQALRQHQYWHPLATPGEADVTAHVDFGALARAGREEEILVHGPVLQGAFLARLGIEFRLQRLCEKVSDKKAKELRVGVHRLIHPDEMGALFKAMCLSSPGLATPAGFGG